MQDLDPHLLRAFLSVIDVGTVNGAAAALHRTQAAVSMQIRRLEDIAGTPLFERSPKGLTANAEGRILEPYAREIITLNEVARQRICGHRLEGRVKLGVVEDFAATRLIDILKSFRDQNPNVHLDLIIAGNRQLTTLFEQDKLDLLIGDTQGLAHEPLVEWPEKLLWVARSDLTLSPGAPLPVILFTETCPWRMPVMTSLADSQLRWNMVCEASTLVAMATAVQVGIGIGPMISATIPAGCRVLPFTPDYPSPIQLGIGLYARSGASEEANYLADFITRMPGRLAA
ncbi:LysR substrate-binding domain-containing protein [Polaromonas sp.]|uniref:LysR substrate-binding domain-containing protein n=1 Tax=Polaromonas sp. TaxID=1869339 RepID=UPI00286D6275|nr:LysR substrate-binding domain-containing protein [Polaromonas sp.]